MADLAITVANVKPQSGARQVTGVAGATVAQGDVVYLDTTTNSYKLADNNSATAAARSPAGIALNAALVDQPLTIATYGPIAVGATVTAGVGYYLSDTPGKICPVADLATGEYPVFLGFAAAGNILNINIQEAGVSL